MLLEWQNSSYIQVQAPNLCLLWVYALNPHQAKRLPIQTGTAENELATLDATVVSRS
jgi:hypothetical protein